MQWNPGGQGVGEDSPDKQKNPIGHTAVACDMPAVGQYMPSGHGIYWSSELEGQYAPAGHCKATELPYAGQYELFLHGIGCVSPVDGQKVPGGDNVGALNPVDEQYPPGVHNFWPEYTPGQNEPIAQVINVDKSIILWQYVPGGALQRFAQ